MNKNSIDLPQMISWVENEVGAKVIQSVAVGGGCISQCFKLKLSSGEQYFLKFHPTESLFAQEADGLAAINQQVPNFAPVVIATHAQGILLENFDEQRPDQSYWIQLATRLAQLHSKEQPAFGFDTYNFCGRSVQVNTQCNNGFEFFAKYRLVEPAQQAFAKGLLPQKTFKDIESIAERLPKLLPNMPAVLIHGDLWSGNAFNSSDGAKIFDPAVYWGWAEAELAMTCLFGGFSQSFYHTYQEVSSISNKWRSRVPLYNLYHLINHLRLFGKSYFSDIAAICAQYR